LVAIEYSDNQLHPRWGIWDWDPRSSLETQDMYSLKCYMDKAFGGIPRVHLTASRQLELNGIYSG
jgi:hypothetical protein